MEGHHDNSGNTVTWHDVLGPVCDQHGPVGDLLVSPADGDVAWWVCAQDGAALRVQPWH